MWKRGKDGTQKNGKLNWCKKEEKIIVKKMARGRKKWSTEPGSNTEQKTLSA